ncbi:hydrogenase (NiFe) small subunit HydA [Magnetococcus marinus MC-1]|uniref:hydrogenase (acceptor) n=1 Tax=Magnetococcus marinus (strain ATCC BAA-1437 / JCM 17883 / MC-1) TaxID=156889 RepID=A0LAL3_MAGMM|nr:hydrogenase small subunit [Magnetococcus marinus]ABK45006.1 hydrogenase (NiFe) small subunit HydA [Magnetococcus marinus MC-1]
MAVTESDFLDLEQRLGVSRRAFLKFCAGVAASMGLGGNAGLAMAEAVVTAKKRPPVIWLHGQECTGPSETLLRSEQPSLETLILDLISLEYHQTLDAGAGHGVEARKRQSMEENKGKYVLVIEGSIPLADGGIYCKIGGQTMLEATKEAAEHAAAIIAFGSCASWGGVPSSGINPTGAVGAPAVITDKPVVTIPGCPPNPANFLGTVLYFVTYGKLPPLDAQGRPKWAYGRLIHENCYRRPHFDAGRFATQFGDEGHKQGWCLYKLGCKGPETYNNCPSLEFNNVGGGVWPVGVGHPCFGCSEGGVGFTKPLFSLADVKTHTAPNTFPAIDSRENTNAASALSAGLAGVGIGVAIGAGAMAAKKLGQQEHLSDDQG